MAKDDPATDETQRTDDEGATDQDIIDDAKAYLEFCNAADNGNRVAMLDDLQFIAGDQWDPKAKRQRELDGRPCLTINKLPTFLHQVTNDQRENVTSIKVAAVDSKSDPKTANILQGMVRHIEYSSNADTCYDTAVNGAAGPGIGYFGLLPQYCRPDSFDQELRFRRFRNPFTVWFDPASQEPDGSDAKRCLIAEKRRTKELQQEFKNLEVTTEGLQGNGASPGTMTWIWDDFMLLAEYYRIEYTPDRLIMLANGETGYKSDLLDDGGNEIIDERETMRQKLMCYTLTALQVLKRTEIKCKWIPVFPVYGDEIDLDGKVVRQGLIRNAKDPARMYNYWMTSATEEVALRTKTPYVGAEGQFEGYEDDWGQANVKSFPYLEYKPVTLEGALVPPPQRQPMTDVPVGYLHMCEHANDNIKATTGLFDSSLGARGSATSGVQERQQQRQGDLANFHYTDNKNKSIRHAGRCLIDMIPHYYDTERVVRIMGEDGKLAYEEINKPTQQQVRGPGGQIQTIEKILNDLSVGEYDVTVSAGPGYSTLRQESAQQLMELGGKWPKLLDVAGDKLIGNMDFPEAQEIGERLKRTIPPSILGPEDAENGEAAEPTVQTPAGPVSIEQASQMMLAMDAQMQEMQTELQDAASGIAKAKVDAAAKIEVANINAASKEDVEELKGFIQILIAKMQPPPMLAAEVADDLNGSGSAASGQAARAGSSPTPPAETSAQPAPSIPS